VGKQLIYLLIRPVYAFYKALFFPRKEMTLRKFDLLLVAVLIAFMLILSSSISTVIAAPSPTPSKSLSINCLFAQFKATIYTGPDAGMSLQGNLHLHIDPDGSVTGVLKQANGPDIHSVGQANGRAINLIFDLGQNRLIYGVGTLQNPIQMCKGSAGGPFVGPDEKDAGSWLAPRMCSVDLHGSICVLNQASHGNPDYVMYPQACCK
jgi:hypothetical protein